jgi:DNA helicase-2/ATP-dependent DNA helicase PcrA
VLAAEQNQLPIFTFCEEWIANPLLFSELKLGSKQKEGLQNYIRLIHFLRGTKKSMKIHELISEVISESNYLSHLKEDPETFQDRKENVDELISTAAQWEDEQEEATLEKFLEELSLRSHITQNTDLPSIKLMTIHNSKGMEFNLVFLVGMEEDLFPHINTKDDAKAIEEERRLCYVGMTRAKRYLYLCSASSRYMWGTSRFMRSSRFLKEISNQYLEKMCYPPRHLDCEEIAETPSDDFSPGDKVLHQQFGSGIIQNVSNSSLGLTYEVYFPQAQISRTLVAKYAKLQHQDESHSI